MLGGMDEVRAREPAPEELRGLYARPPAEFVAARNELASRLNREARREAAQAVRRLGRPSPALWAVNRLSVEAPADVAALLDAGDGLRRAQSRVIGGERRAADDLRELGQEQGRLLARLRARAAQILSAAGHPASDDTLRRVESTLRSAALAGAEARRALTEARLTAELEPSGFVDVPIFAVLPGGGGEEAGEAAPGAGASSSAPPPAVDAAAAERARQVQEARQRFRIAERELALRETAARRAQEAAERAEERVRTLQQQLGTARQEAAASAERARRAEAAVEEARRALEEVRAPLPG
jgi:hypothetical protein